MNISKMQKIAFSLIEVLWEYMIEVNHGKFVMIGDFIAGAEEYA